MTDGLNPEQVAYYRRVLLIHASLNGECGICGVRRCPDWVDAYDKLAAAHQLMTTAERMMVINRGDRYRR